MFQTLQNPNFKFKNTKNLEISSFQKKRPRVFTYQWIQYFILNQYLSWSQVRDHLFLFAVTKTKMQFNKLTDTRLDKGSKSSVLALIIYTYVFSTAMPIKKKRFLSVWQVPNRCFRESSVTTSSANALNWPVHLQFKSK